MFHFRLFWTFTLLNVRSFGLSSLRPAQLALKRKYNAPDDKSIPSLQDDSNQIYQKIWSNEAAGRNAKK